MPSIAVILPAAGRSSRFGRDKLSELLAGESVFSRSAGAFLDRLGADVACIVFVMPKDATQADALPQDLMNRFSDLPPLARGIKGGVLGDEKDTRSSTAPTLPSLAKGNGKDARLIFAQGGSCRAESVLNGILAVPQEIDFVAIHDAARPLVSQDLITHTFTHAFAHGSAVPALPVKLTIKQATGPLPARVERTLPRNALWEMQTPQVANRAQLLAAYAACDVPLDQITDDVQLLERAGQPVWLVPGEESNLKITTPQDLLLAEQLIRARID